LSTLFGFLFVALLLFSIALHEFGHLITAKMTGMKVHQYFIGFGPKLWSTQRGETEYGVKALPLGGFVRIAGMNPYEEIEPEDSDRVYKAKKPWQRAIVLSAGSFTHFVLAMLILAMVFMLSDTPDFDRPTTTVGAVSQTLDDGSQSPARAAGIEVGDRIIAVHGTRVDTWDETIAALQARPEQRTRIRIERAGDRLTLTATLADHVPVGETERVGFLGVGPRFESIDYGFFSAVGEGGKTIARGTVLSLKGLKNIVAPSTFSDIAAKISGSRPRTLDDPATVVGLTGHAGQLGRAGDWAGLFLLIAAFNIFIGVANMLPLPPLDGGHLAVLAYEKIRRRDVDVRKLIPISATVILFFGTLFLMLLVLEISQPISLPQ
jgi:membrane-associated protease RseP (regulator of RpoE activity)